LQTYNVIMQKTEYRIIPIPAIDKKSQTINLIIARFNYA
jgi:hypothetical protein